MLDDILKSFSEVEKPLPLTPQQHERLDQLAATIDRLAASTTIEELEQTSTLTFIYETLEKHYRLRNSLVAKE